MRLHRGHSVLVHRRCHPVLQTRRAAYHLHSQQPLRTHRPIRNTRPQDQTRLHISIRSHYLAQHNHHLPFILAWKVCPHTLHSRWPTPTFLSIVHETHFSWLQNRHENVVSNVCFTFFCGPLELFFLLPYSHWLTPLRSALHSQLLPFFYRPVKDNFNPSQLHLSVTPRHRIPDPQSSDTSSIHTNLTPKHTYSWFLDRPWL